MSVAAYVTDDYFTVVDVGAFTGDLAAHRAIQDWVRKHGLDPKDLAASGPIHRDEERCRIVYAAIHKENHPGCIFEIEVQQGETPPMPWPAELDRYRVAR